VRSLALREIRTMADPKDDPKNRRSTERGEEKTAGYKSGGGNIGAGKSGKEVRKREAY
jgi:hypothetical protein